MAGPASDRLFVTSTGLCYLARNWKFESISLQRGVCKLSVPKMSASGERYGRDALGHGNLSLEEASNCGPECASAHYHSNPH